MMVRGSADHTLRLWNLVTKECVKVFNGHTNVVLCIAVLPDGRLISGSKIRTLRIWNLTTGATDIVLKEGLLWGTGHKLHLVSLFSPRTESYPVVGIAFSSYGM